MVTMMPTIPKHLSHENDSQSFCFMKFMRFIVFLKWNRISILQVLAFLVSDWFIYLLWTEPTTDSRAEKLIISLFVIIANIIFEIGKSVSI